MFERIYLVELDNNGKKIEHYLTINCRATNVLSISLTPARQFEEAPTFNIYGTSKSKAKMGRGAYTLINQCNAYAEVGTQNFIEIRRNNFGEPIISFSQFKLR